MHENVYFMKNKNRRVENQHLLYRKDEYLISLKYKKKKKKKGFKECLESKGVTFMNI